MSRDRMGFAVVYGNHRIRREKTDNQVVSRRLIRELFTHLVPNDKFRST